MLYVLSVILAPCLMSGTDADHTQEALCPAGFERIMHKVNDYALSHPWKKADRNWIRSTPDGQWFVYIHAPRGSRKPDPCKDAILAAYNFATKEHRVLATIDSAIHHVQPYGNQRFVFCHTPTGNGMMLATLEGAPWTHLRDRDPGVSCLPCWIVQALSSRSVCPAAACCRWRWANPKRPGGNTSWPKTTWLKQEKSTESNRPWKVGWSGRIATNTACTPTAAGERPYTTCRMIRSKPSTWRAILHIERHFLNIEQD